MGSSQGNESILEPSRRMKKVDEIVSCSEKKLQRKAL